MGFLTIKTVKFLAIPMNIRIETAFGTKVNKLSYLYRDDTLYVMVLAVLSLYNGFSSNGLWCRLIRMIFILPAILAEFPRLSILLKSLTKAINSINVAIGLFAYLVMTYAAFGKLIFKHNDPYHFGSYGLSLWSFFHFAVFDTWSELWYINYYGCDAVPSELVMDLHHTDNRFINTKYGHFKYNTCENPSAYPYASTVIFLSYTFICGYICVNLILAAVVIGVKNGLDDYKQLDCSSVTTNVESSIHSDGSNSFEKDKNHGSLTASSSMESSFAVNNSASSFSASFNVGGSRTKRSTLMMKRDNHMLLAVEKLNELEKWRQMMESIWAGVVLTTSKSYADEVHRSGNWYSIARVCIEMERWLSGSIHSKMYMLCCACSTTLEVLYFYLVLYSNDNITIC